MSFKVGDMIKIRYDHLTKILEFRKESDYVKYLIQVDCHNNANYWYEQKIISMCFA